MKKSDLKEKSRVFYIGRGVVITAVIVTCSLGFILGFVVGKNTSPHPSDKAPITAPLAGTIQKNIAADAKESAGREPQKIQPIQTSGVQNPPAKPEQQKTKETGEGAGVNKDLQRDEAKQRVIVSPQVKENEKTAAQQESPKPQDSQEDSKKAKYTVQIGAFKSKAEADSLKAKFSKKGYKASILAVKSKKHEKLYKVMLGEFGNRKEAELLSVKIKKAEGLRTFVTLKAG